MTLALAIVGAVTGVISLGWQVFTWSRGAARIGLELRLGATMEQGYLHERLHDADGLARILSAVAEGASPLLIIQARNTGRAAGTLATCAVHVGPNSKPKSVQQGGLSDGLPARIEGHGELTMDIDFDELHANHADMGERAFVRVVGSTGTGKIIYSKLTTLGALATMFGRTLDTAAYDHERDGS